MGVPHTRPLGRDRARHPAQLIERLPAAGGQAPGAGQRRGAAGVPAGRGRPSRASGSPCTCRTTWRRPPTRPPRSRCWSRSQRATGLVLPGDALREAARRTDLEIARQVEGSAEVAEVVQALEQQYDAFAADRENLLASDEARADRRGARRPVRAVPGRAAGPRQPRASGCAWPTIARRLGDSVPSMISRARPAVRGGC